jgi:Ni/Co efflux regulator RcnB
MNRMIKAFALPIVALALSGLPAFAQEHPDQDRHDQAHSQDRHDNGNYRHHDDWKKGSHMRHEDWDRGEKLDYRQYHLQRPPSGREWRNVDGNFILGNSDGVIFSIRTAPHDR